MVKLISLSILFITIWTSPQNFCQRHKSVDPITITNAHNLTIKGDSINGDEEPCLTLKHCNNIHITNCFFGNSTRVGIYLYDCSNIIIDNCFVTNVSTGIYVEDSYAISVTHCEGKNMKGPYPRGAFVQFNNVRGPRCRVNYNTFENILGQCHAEDDINMYRSHGAEYDPIQIIGNKIRGGGPSLTSGGIMLGDNGGAYQVARDNILVNPGQYGMAISGGDHISIINNKIYSKGQVFTNVGLYIWAQADAQCSFDEVSNNQVNWKNKHGEQNDVFDGGNCGTVPGWKTNVTEARIDESILPRQLLSTCYR
ncbi:MAG: right-handed parallel beta-helix repeat-containing protein [Mucilaginibacter sp.]